MRIALDTMGGDNGPEPVCRGAWEYAGLNQDVELTLWGPRERLAALLDRMHSESGSDGRRQRIEIGHCTEVIEQNDEPVAAIRRKKDSSMVCCFRQVSSGAADAVVTVGNTGAVLAGGVLIAKRISGVERPALAAEIPTSDRTFLFLDLGANSDNRPQHLLDYAHMGLIYASEVMGIDRPSVGLLNIGTENKKGDKLRRDTLPLLQDLCRSSGYEILGNIESRNLLRGDADVVVTDGFVGNMLLKAVEGLAEVFSEAVRQEMHNSLSARVGGMLIKPRMQQVFSKFDYRNYGGAVLLGLQSLVVKCHGISQSSAIISALETAKQSVEAGIPRIIEASMQKERNTNAQ